MIKSILLFCLITNFSWFAQAQAPDIQWAKCIGGSNLEEAYAVAQSPDSGFVVVGLRSSFDGDCSDCPATGYLYVVKLDSIGNIIWKKCYGGSTYEYAMSVVSVSSGGYVIAGTTSSTDGDVEGNHGGYDIWVIKIDESGSLEWQRCYGGSSTDQATEIIQTTDGGFAIAGISASNDGDVTDHHGDEFNYDYWVVKINSVGDIEWQKSLGGSEYDVCWSIIQMPNGNLVCGGYTLSNDGDIEEFHLLSDYWVVQLDHEGSIIWENIFGGTGGEAAYTIKLTSDLKILIVGYTSSLDGDVTDYIGGSSDLWAVKIDSLGALEWQKTYGGSDSDIANFINKAEGNDHLICGVTVSSDGDVSNNNLMGGIWVIALDSLGILKWEKSLGGSNIENSYGIVSTFDGGSICVGYTVSNDGDVTDNHGERDFWIVKLSRPCPQQTFYADTDNDGYGDTGNYLYSCVDTFGYVLNNLDCDDANQFIHPGVTDICNSIDDNCNLAIDEDASFLTWYRDFDSDGFGNVENDSISCYELAGYVFDTTDCNDVNDDINPATEELCNSIDDNCNLFADEGLINNLYYFDGDEDNYGNIEEDTLWCAPVTGYVIDGTDCDDTDPDIYPGATETLNGIDDDCDQTADEGLSIIENEFVDLTINPNPTISDITLQFNILSSPTLTIYQMTGEIMYFVCNVISPYTFNTISFAPGVYFINLQDENKAAQGMFIKN